MTRAWRCAFLLGHGTLLCQVHPMIGNCHAQVQGSRQGDHYTVFPQHYCSCQAFLYSVVGHGHPVVRPLPLTRLFAICQSPMGGSGECLKLTLGK